MHAMHMYACIRFSPPNPLVGPAPFDRDPGLAAGTELLSILQYSCFFYL
jgi:hypothetical protein